MRGGAFGGSGSASDRLISHDLARGRCISGLALGVLREWSGWEGTVR